MTEEGDERQIDQDSSGNSSPDDQRPPSDQLPPDGHHPPKGQRPPRGQNQQGDQRLPGNRGELRLSEKFCPDCGAIISRQAEICPDCGVRQHRQAIQVQNNKDRTTAAVLALVLGSVGAHKFYLDESGLGLLYLCFFWTGVPAVIGIIEGLIYFMNSDEEFQRQYV